MGAFSPSTFGLALAGENDHGQDLSQDPDVKSILDQLALWDAPETKANPNPERPLLRLDWAHKMMRAGDEADVDSRFL
jgi:hypothetical protein